MTVLYFNKDVNTYLGRPDIAIVSKGMPNRIPQNYSTIRNSNIPPNSNLLEALKPIPNMAINSYQDGMNDTGDMNRAEDMSHFRSIMQRYREAQCYNANQQNIRISDQYHMKNAYQDRNKIQNPGIGHQKRQPDDTRFAMEYRNSDMNNRQNIPMAYGTGYTQTRPIPAPIIQVSQNNPKLKPWFEQPLLHANIEDSENDRLDRRPSRCAFTIDYSVVHFHERISKVYRRLGEDSSFITSNKNLSQEKVDKYFCEEAYLPTQKEDDEGLDSEKQNNDLYLQTQNRYYHQFLCEICFESSGLIFT